MRTHISDIGSKPAAILSRAVLAVLGLTASSALAAPYALPDASTYDYEDALVTSTSLGTAGTAEDHNINAFTAYSGWTTASLNVGNTQPYVDLLILGGSTVSTTGTNYLYVGGDNVGSGQTTVAVDASTVTVAGQTRVGSRNSGNSLYIQNGGVLNANGGVNPINNDGVSNNKIVVTGAGSQFNSPLDFLAAYGNSSGSVTVENGGHLTVGTSSDTTYRRLRIRNGHDTSIAVTGAGSKIDVYGTMTLGESSGATGFSENNKLVLEDGGSLWIHNVTNNATVFSAALKTGGIAHQIRLGDGFLVVKGNQVNNTVINPIVWADNGSGYAAGVKGTATWHGSEWDFVSSGNAGNYYAFYVDGTAGQSYLVGGVETAGYTVFTNVVPVPEPASLAILGLGGLLMSRRRRA